MSSLPEEILEEIFLRLQVKELLRCRCVCKPWCTLIHCPEFIYKHLDLRIEEYNSTLMFQYGETRIDEYYTINCNSLLSSLASSPTETYECDESVKMDYPLISADFGVEILGSSDGLFCVRTNHPGASDAEDAITLWNPSTNEYKELPASENHFSSDDTSLYGFGYDYQVDDYKVVRVVDFNEHGYHDVSSVEVYTLRSNSWKDIDGVPYVFPGNKKIPGILVNGALHWFGASYHYPRFVIVAFDICMETFEDFIVDGPIHLQKCDENIHNDSLGVLGGCLCLLLKEFGVKVDLWVMEAYGVTDSWTKRFTITQESITRNNFLKLKWDLMNGEILLMGDEFLIYYDSNSNRHKRVTIRGARRGELNFIEVETFVPSLVSLKSSTYVQRRMLEQ